MLHNLKVMLRGWTVLRVLEACISLAHVQHLVLPYGNIVVTDLKIISQTENDLKSCRGQFIALLYTISDMLL